MGISIVLRSLNTRFLICQKQKRFKPAISWCHIQWERACWRPIPDRPSPRTWHWPTSRPCWSHRPRASRPGGQMSWRWRRASWTSWRRKRPVSPRLLSSSPHHPPHLRRSRRDQRLPRRHQQRRQQPCRRCKHQRSKIKINFRIAFKGCTLSLKQL